MKKVFIGFLFASSILLTSCNKEYSYINPNEPVTDLKATLEEGVRMDGIDDEFFYKEDQTLDFKCGIYNDVDVKFKVGFGSKGLLAFAHVSKSNFYEDSSLDIFKQDSFEIYINPSTFRKDLTAQCVQFRLSPLLRHETWIGVASENYPWTKYFMSINYGTRIFGEINTSKTDKNVASAVCYEFYLPYSNLGLDYNPEGLYILPALVNASGCISGAYKWDSYNHIGMSELDKYPFFGKRVYKEQTNNLINTDYTDVGYEAIDQDKGETIQKGCYDQYAKINFPDCKVFEAKVEINCIKRLNNDKTPKVGLALRNEANTVGFLLDPRVNKDNYQTLIVNRLGDIWDWENAPIVWGGKDSYEKVELEIIRNNQSIYFLQNGVLVYKSNADLLNNLDCGVYLLTMNYYARFFNIAYSLDNERIKNRCDALDLVNLPFSSNGFTINSKDNVSSIGEHDSYLVLNYYGNHYEFKANVKIGEVLLDDEYPKIGLLEQTRDKINSIMIDPHKDHLNKELCFVKGNVDESNRNWNWVASFKKDSLDFSSYIELKIIRNHNNSSYYVNNELIYETSNGFNEQISNVGMITMNHTSNYKDISFTNLGSNEDK